MVARAFGRKRDSIVEDIELSPGRRARRRWPRVEDRDDPRSGFDKRMRSAIAIVIVGRDHDTLARQHAEPLNISARGLGEHDTGTVVVGKRNRAFDAANRKDHLPCPDMPQALGNTVRRNLPGFDDPFAERQEIMIPIARCRRPRQDASPRSTDARGGGVDPRGVEFLRIADQ